MQSTKRAPLAPHSIYVTSAMNGSILWSDLVVVKDGYERSINDLAFPFLLELLSISALSGLS